MENPYRTLINEYEVKQLQVFYLHGGERTALAEAELEYRDDYQNKSVYIQSSQIWYRVSSSGHGIEDYEACRNALLQKIV
ncbi:unnamed protein product [Rhizophagus irregularis]|nr:unnamed protein product [Rhizophagus irregularis]CAB5372522.1 unnamed protein product [Rhizophagus irregularis]